MAAGLAFAPLAAGLKSGSLLVPRLSRRIGPAVLALGGTVMGAGVLALAALVLTQGRHASIAVLSLVFAVIGLGNGTALPPLVNTVVSAVPRDHAGSVGGLLSTAQQVGAALGVSGVGALFFHLLGPAPTPDGYAHAFGVCLVCDAALLAMTTLANKALAASARTA